MAITIRKATPEDAYDWAECSIHCWQSAYRDIYPSEIMGNLPLEKEQRIEKYKKRLATPGEVEYYTVLHSRKMIGFLVTSEIHSEIYAIYLLEEFWGKGYGKEVMAFAVNKLTRVNPKEITLWVFEKNTRARRFYEKYGFMHDGGRKPSNRYDIPMDELRYVLPCENVE